MRTSINKNRLCVEDNDTCHFSASLMGCYVEWSNDEAKRPVHIEVMKSVTKVLDHTELSAAIKAETIETLGIVVDADSERVPRWQCIRDFCSKFGAEGLPENCPPDGFITSVNVGDQVKKFGCWIMPDNCQDGMIEDLFIDCILDDDPIRAYALEAAVKASSLGAPYNQYMHRQKAHVRTWLAWQEEPGIPFGVAIQKKLINHEAVRAKKFAEWFQKLFNLPGK